MRPDKITILRYNTMDGVHLVQHHLIIHTYSLTTTSSTRASGDAEIHFIYRNARANQSLVQLRLHANIDKI
jgi:hypothetical protein